MGVLAESTKLWGNATLIESDPGEEVLSRVTFIPFRREVHFDDDREWGVYHRNGQLVQAAAYYRGPNKQLVGQSEATEIDATTLDYLNEEFVYGGPVILHYGRFLTATLPRLWHLISHPGKRRRIICHSHEAPETWFAHDFIRDLLGAIGLTKEDFFRPKLPCRLRLLRVPRPAMEERNFIHRSMDRLAISIGKYFDLPTASSRRGTVYLSRTQIPRTAKRFADEQVLEHYMSEKGATILHLQELSFPDMLRGLAGAEVITGIAWSALYCSVFLSHASRNIMLTTHDEIDSNHVMIDRLKGNNSIYLHPLEQGTDVLDPKRLVGQRKVDMDACARAFLEYL